MTLPRLGLSAPRPVRAPTLTAPLLPPLPLPFPFPPTHILNTLRSKSTASFHPSSSLVRKERGEGEEEQSTMIQSPGGGSACHGVSLFIWSDYQLKNDCDAKKEEIKKTQKRRVVAPVVSTHCCVAALGGRHILDGCGSDFTGGKKLKKSLWD